MKLFNLPPGSRTRSGTYRKNFRVKVLTLKTTNPRKGTETKDRYFPVITSAHDGYIFFGLPEGAEVYTTAEVAAIDHPNRNR